MSVSIIGIIQIVVGVILVIASPFLGGSTAPIGYGLIVSGALSIVAGFLFKPGVTESSSGERSPTYGFSQFDNPVKGDSALSVIYSNDTAAEKPGHKVAPVYLAAFTTPRGFEVGDDDAKIISSRGQGLSCLLAIGEGPIVDVTDIRVNDEPLYEEKTAIAVTETANGTRKNFTIPVRRLDIDSVRVYVGGTLKGWQLRNKTEDMIGLQANGTKFLWHKDLSAEINFVSENAPTFYSSGATSAVPWVTNLSTGPRIHCWTEAGTRDGSATRLYVNTQVPLVAGSRLFVRWTERYCDGFTLSLSSDKKTLQINFATAPTNGSKITVDYRRRKLPGIRIEWRRGGDTQLPIPDFNSIRNTVGLDLPLGYGASNAQSFTTSEPVDDVIVDIASGDGGFTQYDSKTGVRSEVSALLKFQYQTVNAMTGALGTPVILNDPGGSRGSKGSNEFEFRGDQLSKKYYSISIRNVLRQLADGGTATDIANLANFKRSKYKVSVSRTNQVGNTSNAYILDLTSLMSYQKVIDEPLLYPGVALLGIHALASDRLNGSAPRITCKVRGLRNVESWNSVAWVTDEANQANPVWAAIDLITAERYGGGAQFTKSANIDVTSAVTAAAWCDAIVTNQDGTTEKRAVLDYVADTRADLMEHVRSMLLPAQIVPVIRGNVWFFIIDRDVILSTVPVVYDDTSDGRTMKDSMTCNHQPLTTQITELQVNYYDRDDDFERNELWRSPIAPATDRRIERATAFGVTRVTQATRYSEFLYQKARQQGVQVAWAMSPGGMRLQAGDVLRVISQRLGIDLYVRVLRVELDSTESYAIKVETAQYVPAVYGQNVAKQTIIYRTSASGQSAAAASAESVGANNEPIEAPQVEATVERVA